jgi:hypothetical protein
VRLAHLGDTSLVVRGSVSGAVYLFPGSGGEPLPVEESDLPGLLALRRFRRMDGD